MIKKRRSWLHPVLVHHPLRLPALGRPPLVEHERLAHPHQRASPRRHHWPVLPRRLPVPGHRSPVRPLPRRVLAVLEAEEVPLPRPHRRRHCMPIVMRTREGGEWFSKRSQQLIIHSLFLAQWHWLAGRRRSVHGAVSECALQHIISMHVVGFLWSPSQPHAVACTVDAEVWSHSARNSMGVVYVCSPPMHSLV